MKTLQLIVYLLFATHVIHSQETILVSGGNATGSGGLSSYSVGQLMYTTNTGSGTVSQGIQQSIELYTLNNPESTTLTLKAVIYPNPTTDYIVLALKNCKFTNLSYEMYDLQGRKVAKVKVVQTETPIAMQNLASGSYILKVNENNQALKIFKIIKK